MLKTILKATIMIFLALIILLLSWLNYNNTKNLTGQIGHLQSEIQNIRHQVASDVGSIRGTVNSMREDNLWWRPAQVEMKAIDGENALIDINWLLTEFNKGSQVDFHYKGPQDEEYKTIAATEEGNGYYSVQLEEKINLEPIWDHISISHADNSATNSAKEQIPVAEKVVSGPDGSASYNYYISLQDGDSVKSTDIRNFSLMNLSQQLFNPLGMNIGKTDKELTVDVYEIYGSKGGHEIKQISLQSRDAAGKVLRNWNLEKVDEKHRHPEVSLYRSISIPNEDLSNLIFVQVEYKEGTISEREIHL